MTFYFYKSRWIKFAGAWKDLDYSAQGKWADFSTFVKENRVKEASGLAVKLIKDSKDWEQDFLMPLLQEDNSAVQLNTLIAVMGELKHQQEWQHYISGAVTYGIDMKQGQTVLSAAKFGRSYLR